MKRNIFFIAALVAAFISSPLFAQNIPNATDSYRSPTIATIPTPQPEALFGNPPVGIMNPTTGKYEPVTTSNPMPVRPLGPNGATATVLIPLPAIGLATRSITLIATNAVTLLQNIASFTDRSFIMFQPRAKIYWSVLSGTSATAADMQAGAYSMEAGDTPVVLRLMRTSNLAFTADPASPATLTYTIGQEQ